MPCQQSNRAEWSPLMLLSYIFEIEPNTKSEPKLPALNAPFAAVSTFFPVSAVVAKNSVVQSLFKFRSSTKSFGSSDTAKISKLKLVGKGLR